jgi:hypothetical protein
MNLSEPYLQKVFINRTSDIYSAQKRRARKYRQEIQYSLEAFREWVLESEICTYCRVRLTVQTFSADHNLPVSRVSGPAAWSIGNIAICCGPCNLAKGNLSGGEFERLLQAIKDFAPVAQQSILARLRAGARKCAGKGW